MKRRAFIKGIGAVILSTAIPNIPIKYPCLHNPCKDINFPIRMIRINATKRVLKGTWTVETSTDLTALYGMDVEQELIDILQSETS